MNNIFLIFMGAGVGGVLRYWVSNAVYLLVDRGFPYGTMVVNISGCLLMGFLFTLLIDRIPETGSHWRALLLIGLLGGYTTFSSFAIETVNLIENGNLAAGFINMLLSTVLCAASAWLGVMGGRLI